jgi:alpha-glucosidase/alpha-D-xyloside xylohydrolase
MIDQIHADHFKVSLHIVVEGRRFIGTVSDPCTAPPLPPGRLPAAAEGQQGQWPPDRQVSCYWPAHKPLFDLGIDGWWPDQGDGFDGPSRLNRHRMYFDGPQLYRPNVRPFALHRNASPGIQRYGGFIWSGDVATRWETLKLHVPNAINTSLSGLPYWGTDIGGFNRPRIHGGAAHPMVSVRRFNRCTDRTDGSGIFACRGMERWGRRPAGDGTEGRSCRAATPENDMRRYLELVASADAVSLLGRPRCASDGCRSCALCPPIPDDPSPCHAATSIVGPDILVAPVVEKGATSRRLYLPPGVWVRLLDQ